MARADELRELLVRHFNRLGLKLPTCPFCQHDEWGVEAMTLTPTFDDTPTGPTFRNESIGAIPMVCTTCGFIYQVSMGIVKTQDGKSG